MSCPALPVIVHHLFLLELFFGKGCSWFFQPLRLASNTVDGMICAIVDVSAGTFIDVAWMDDVVSLLLPPERNSEKS